MCPSNPDFYTPTGLNWDAIRENYDRHASPEERKIQSMTSSEIMQHHGWKQGGEPRVIKANVPDAVKERGPGSTIPIDIRVKLVAAYSDKKKVVEIAKEFGFSERTVRLVLQRANVYDANRDKGGPRPSKKAAE